MKNLFQIIVLCSAILHASISAVGANKAPTSNDKAKYFIEATWICNGDSLGVICGSGNTIDELLENTYNQTIDKMTIAILRSAMRYNSDIYGKIVSKIDNGEIFQYMVTSIENSQKTIRSILKGGNLSEGNVQGIIENTHAPVNDNSPQYILDKGIVKSAWKPIKVYYEIFQDQEKTMEFMMNVSRELKSF